MLRYPRLRTSESTDTRNLLIYCGFGQKSACGGLAARRMRASEPPPLVCRTFDALGEVPMGDIRLTVRVDFGADRALGPGKIRLLEAIDKTGSISQAGR